MWGNLIAGSKAMEQSILSLRGEIDCFAEHVIGRAFARPVGSQRRATSNRMDDGGLGGQLGQLI
jgi:hypothetical protein